ncbi:FHA domain-containing protein [Roseofilum capinflatum]|uniref:FHA domain-containing protein n=1 Tax=Roseofilum capinflatum BLCC-M114 TaxID=3022440 RepID=A0ABT7B482_9CYAN|nr:FHA domain-containing protein [Roseofilum capinflatum]MDJ1173945.1 FHA domain-containing protein [Roseofilum capinflatum BLCC-M114]
MIVCPNCTHQNPDGAQVCEACYTDLPALTTCFNCGATVQQDATFCGQCGTPLNPTPPAPDASEEEESVEIPALVEPDPLVVPDPITPSSSESSESSEIESEASEASTPPSVNRSTELQSPSASLVHVSTGQSFELSTHLPVLNIGKPNDRLPPEIDVSGFAHSDVVSRVHAAIRIEEGHYYIEDLGSSNGTYINHLPLSPGDRHQLQAGDRITLGKNDLVTFLFQM